MTKRHLMTKRRLSRKRKKYLTLYAVGKNAGPQHVSKEEWALEWEEHVLWNVNWGLP